ncbi:MAG: glucose 1-dehydrogenase [Bacteroidota bacterium]
MQRFTDKVALITGAASGIGQATALAAAQEGAAIILLDIQTEALETTTRKIAEAGGRCLPLLTDVTNHEAVRQAVQQGAAHFGGIDFLCCSAGLQTYGTVESTTEADWDRAMDVNLKHMFLVGKYVIPEMKKRGGGSVVNISSVQGINCQSNVLAYATSKGAAIALSRAMAMDHASDKIRVNCLCPGSIDTPLLRYGAGQHGEVEAVLRDWGSQHPIGRIGQAEEVAQTVLFLWSQAAGFITAQPIVVDGGLISGIL